MARLPKAARPDDLFISLAEQVKLPFVQIAHAAELMEDVRKPEHAERSRQTILLASQAALNLIDGYLISASLQREQQLALEPVSLSSVLYDTAQALDTYAKAHGCRLELDLGGRYGPVMSHRRAVQAALTSLGYSMIEAVSAAGKTQTAPVVSLIARRSPHGIKTGVLADALTLNSTALKRARAMYGRAHQPLTGFDGSPGSGIFIADSLFEQLSTGMRILKVGDKQGLAATLLPSRQLNLV